MLRGHTKKHWLLCVSLLFALSFFYSRYWIPKLAVSSGYKAFNSLHGEGLILRSGSDLVNLSTLAGQDVESPHTKPLTHIVWVILGEWKHAEHVVSSIRQANIWNSNSHLVIILPLPLFTVAKEAMSGINVELIDIATMETDDLLISYYEHFFISGDMGGNRNHAEFNKFTSARLFYLHAWMFKARAEHVLHIENDNLVYFDFADWVHNISECGVRVALPCRQMTPQDRIMVAGVVYVRDSTSLALVLRSSLEVLQLGKEKAVQLMETPWINDMSLLGYYYWHNMVGGHPPQRYTPPVTLTILPEGGKDGLGSGDSPSHVDHLRQCVWENAPLVFDNAAIGMWNFGDFFQKKPKTNTHAWGAYERMPANSTDDFEWHENINRRFPTWNGARVASIHMHSKIMGPACS